MDDSMFLRRENEASKRKQFHSISDGNAIVWLISTEGIDQNFHPSLWGSHYSTLILIPGA